MLGTVEGHDATVRREFAKQASTFEDPGYPLTDRGPMEWIRSHVRRGPEEFVLDVAGGTGHVARAFADEVALAVVLDLTREMLETGRRAARAAGQRNVLFVAGDAARMPFLDGSFDLVISRFAVHHFEHPARQLGEMARVCRPGGRVAIVDLVAGDEALAPEQNRLEGMRDPSHVRALSLAELRGLLEDAGLSVMHRAELDQAIGVEPWLAQAQAPAFVSRAIREELEAELDGGAGTGMRPVIRAGELHHTQRWAILLAGKPPASYGA